MPSFTPFIFSSTWGHLIEEMCQILLGNAFCWKSKISSIYSPYGWPHARLLDLWNNIIKSSSVFVDFCKKSFQNTEVSLDSESTQASPSALPSNQALSRLEWYKRFPAQHMGWKNLQKILAAFQISSQFAEEWDIGGKVSCQVSSKIQS